MPQIYRMHFPIYYPLTVAKSKIAGMGAYAKTAIPARKKIGSLGGTLTTIRKGRAAAKTQKTINLVEFEDNKALDAGTNGNDMRFINHSCDPNTYMRILGYHVEFYALRNIKKGEELTCNYGETHHEGQLKCRCGAKNCVGYI